MPEATAPLTGAPQIPDKLYFRIGEVSRLAGVKPYVLRFWESEFPGLGPKKSGTGHRLYRRKDVELVLEIKRLLYEQRFTIEGARKHLDSRIKPADMPKPKAAPKKEKRQQPQVQQALFGGPSPETLESIRKELEDILRLLG
jgi:DNA-binding transcriptional MerR regulator